MILDRQRGATKDIQTQVLPIMYALASSMNHMILVVQAFHQTKGHFVLGHPTNVGVCASPNHARFFDH